MTGARIRLAILLPLLAATATAQDAGDQIRAIRAQSNDAIAAHDVAKIVSFLDKEYQITTSVGSMSQGVDVEAGNWEAVFNDRPDVVYVRTPDRIEISGSNPLAAESGSWVGTWTTASGPIRTGGSYSAMWRRVDGAWKIRSELFVALYCEGVDCP